jgi:hypothetical protein
MLPATRLTLQRGEPGYFSGAALNISYKTGLASSYIMNSRIYGLTYLEEQV